MNIFDAMTSRRSVRHFEKKPVDDNLIGVILYMATQAPSAGNTQDWNFVVVKDEEQKKKLAKAALRQGSIAEAPVVIVVCSDLEKISMKFGKRGETLYASQNTAAAIQNMLLSATALGLGSCWVGSFDEEEIKAILELPDNLKPMAIIPVGYAAETPQKHDRIPFEHVTSAEKYGRGYELTMVIRPDREEERIVGPLSQYLEEYIGQAKKKLGKKEEKKEKLTFSKILKKLIR
jgi:nitroreductase